MILSLVAASCSRSPFPGNDFDGSIEDRAQFIANGMAYVLPVEEDGFKIVSVTPNGRELILETHTRLGPQDEMDAFALTKVLRPIVCSEGYRGFIDKGGVIRFDFKDPNTGRQLPPGRVANCYGY